MILIINFIPQKNPVIASKPPISIPHQIYIKVAKISSIPMDFLNLLISPIITLIINLNFQYINQVIHKEWKLCHAKMLVGNLSGLILIPRQNRKRKGKYKLRK
jgi:hypothetical protein